MLIKTETLLTGVSLCRFVGAFVLNLPVQGFGLFVVGVIVPSHRTRETLSDFI